MKILIPAMMDTLHHEVGLCLRLAKKQGFEIDKFELGISPAQTIQITQGESTIALGADLISSSPVGDLDYYLIYYSQLSLTDYVPSKFPVHVYLNIAEKEQSIDIWANLHGHGSNALVSSDHIPDTEEIRHLSWVIVLLSLQFTIEDALTLSRAMINVSRETWAECIEDFPIPLIEDISSGIQTDSVTKRKQLLFPTVCKSAMALYPVVNSADWVEKLLKMGVKTVQLRIKDSQQLDLEQQIVRSIELGRQYDAQVFINDHWELAIEHQAFGVHLGQEDLEKLDLEVLAEANICLGLSTHGYFELLRVAQFNPSYLALGHIFPTKTKQLMSSPQGLVRLALYQKLVNSMSANGTAVIPTVAIGGINTANAKSVWDCGVTSLALVSAITNAPSCEHAVQFFRGLTEESSTC
ncbi:thiamine phosphate synthase [Vibrio sp. Isolate25]|uniref:thiamine phosphate synthase n=1 Tax=Vibrio sp. Isolate25 TaxID=2908535 RepID=UPI001EFDD76C|nr:thiamine phosphate synthase [Vibrio sp. Isolate25]